MAVPHMRTERWGKMLLAAALAGWLCAVLLCNGLSYRNIVNYEVLYHGAADSWSRAISRGRAGRIGLLALRLLELAVVFGVTRSRVRRAGSLFLGAAAGFSGGMFCCLMVWSRGAAGGLLFLAAGFPQDLAYLPCLFLLLISGISERTVQKDRLFCVILFLTAAGIWMELYVSPLILKLF